MAEHQESRYWCPNCRHAFVTGKFSDDDLDLYDDVCPYCGCYPTEIIDTQGDAQ